MLSTQVQSSCERTYRAALGNEMNISTSFICFHFILLFYWFFFLCVVRRSAFYAHDRSLLFQLFCFYDLSVCRLTRVFIVARGLAINLLRSERGKEIRKHKILCFVDDRAVKCALYHPPTCNSIHLAADVSLPFTVTTCSCCVLLLLHKKNTTRKRVEDENEDEEVENKRRTNEQT